MGGSIGRRSVCCLKVLKWYWSIKIGFFFFFFFNWILSWQTTCCLPTCPKSAFIWWECVPSLLSQEYGTAIKLQSITVYSLNFYSIYASRTDKFRNLEVLFLPKNSSISPPFLPIIKMATKYWVRVPFSDIMVETFVITKVIEMSAITCFAISSIRTDVLYRLIVFPTLI